MFERIKSYFRDIRINLNYPEFERRLRNEHEQHAQRRFSTKQLGDEKEKLVANIESQASAIYDAVLLEKKVERNHYKEDADDIASLLSFFLRDYKQELDAFYAEKGVLLSTMDELFEKKSEIGESLSEVFEEKNKAFGELNYYKDRIESWYAKSDRTPWLFGNAGTKLPKHSLFGQSLGDLDSYKYHRDSAYDDVLEAKRRIESLKQDQKKLHSAIEEIKKAIGELFSRINEVKDDRAKMYELKKAGHKRCDLQSKT
jgi:chromosome segregation ATPase